jgi:hypothetical protein
MLALWAFSIVVMEILFGLLDLQLSVYRNMIFMGLILGLVERALYNRGCTQIVEAKSIAS